jgi:futalosine hydrolase
MLSAEGYLILATATKREMHSALRPYGDLPKLETGKPVPWPCPERSLLLLVTGIGPVNAAMALGRVFGGSLPVAGVVNVGVAGSFDTERLPLESLSVITQEAWPEFGLRTEDGVDARALGLPMGRTEEGRVWNTLDLHPCRSARALGVVLPNAWRPATSVTVAGVSGSPGVAEGVRRYREPDVENMEGFSLAWCCRREKAPFLQIRAMSNKVGSRRSEEWDLQKALDRLGSVLPDLFVPRSSA